MREDENETIARLVRASIAPAGDVAPRRDLWPAVLGRIHERQRVSRGDIALLAALLATIMFFPQAFLFLMYAI
jgi:hypothetical protein